MLVIKHQQKALNSEIGKKTSGEQVYLKQTWDIENATK